MHDPKEMMLFVPVSTSPISGEYGGVRLNILPGETRSVPYAAGNAVIAERPDVHFVTDHPGHESRLEKLPTGIVTE